MAKQMLNIQTFDKGLNSYLDPRDIKAEEFEQWVMREVVEND